MFRDEVQRGGVCWTLCRWIPKSPWRIEDDGRYRIISSNTPQGVSSSEAAMIALSIALWRGDSPVLHLGFDRERMTMVGELIVALGSSASAIDAWRVKWNARYSAQESLG